LTAARNSDARLPDAVATAAQTIGGIAFLAVTLVLHVWMRGLARRPA
jgi:hypothetical protein